MKKFISLLCVISLILISFSACGKDQYITDEEGQTHKLLLKKGEPVQDEYGNLVVQNTDDKGNDVTGYVTYPKVTQAGKDGIQNAFVVLKIPKDWSCEENALFLKITHEGECAVEGSKCESSSKIIYNKTFNDAYKSMLSEYTKLESISDEGYVSGFKEFDTEILGKDAKAYTFVINEKLGIYRCIFEHCSVCISIEMIINNECCDGKFDEYDYEGFISQNYSLKTVPTE